MLLDFVKTLDSDDEGPSVAESSRRPSAVPADDDFDPDFEFDFGGNNDDHLNPWETDPADTKISKGIDIDDIIAKRQGGPIKPYRDGKRKRGLLQGVDTDDDSQSDSSADDDDDQSDDEEDETDDQVGEKGEESADGDDGSSVGEVSDTEAEVARKNAFFSSNPFGDPAASTSFAAMNLSRPLLRALTSLSFSNPTPIQARAVPLALLGRDILGSAVTGSGKTAAFMIPILERLCYRDRGKGGQACRVLVLCPTRELAAQCEAVGRALAEKGGLDVRFALLVGGLSLNAQAHTLRTLPDVLIATPGRLIDHLTNTPSFTLSALDILVIDEADRMLEAGFTDELEEIIKACPRSRQTMLFSATMSDSVDELVRLSLDKPIRVFVDPKRNTATGLTQEFVRIRSDEARSPSLLALCTRTIHDQCIVFFRSKALAHQMRVVFGLCGLKATELHGNLTQEQRLNALNEFKLGRVDFLLATDLASRGLDIKGVETVINYDMPGQLAQYTHRVGRTARAGRKGRSISLVGEVDRKMLKAVVKNSPSDEIRNRIVPSDAVTAMTERLAKLKDEIQDVLKEEKEEKMLRQADMEIKKGQNMVEHEAEIFSRPARTWFQSEKEKTAAKDAGKAAYLQNFPEPAKGKDQKDTIKRGKYDGLPRKAKRRKMAIEADAEDDTNTRASAAAIRAAKKTFKPPKISETLARPAKQGNARSSKPSSKGGKKKSAFDDDGGRKKAFKGEHEGMRAKRVKVTLHKKGKGKK